MEPAPSVDRALELAAQGVKFIALSRPDEPGFANNGWDRTLRAGITLGIAAMGEVLRAYGMATDNVDYAAKTAQGVAVEAFNERFNLNKTGNPNDGIV